MAKYSSRFKELGFYVNGGVKRFDNGEYVTENKDEIAVLDGLSDAQRVVDAVKEAEVVETKTEAKPVHKAPARKASVK